MAGAASAGLRIFVNDAAAAASLAARLGRSRATPARGGRAGEPGLMHPELPGEVEIALPDPYPMTPQVLGALKTVAGVVHIEEF